MRSVAPYLLSARDSYRICTPFGFLRRNLKRSCGVTPIRMGHLRHTSPASPSPCDMLRSVQFSRTQSSFRAPTPLKKQKAPCGCSCFFEWRWGNWSRVTKHIRSFASHLLSTLDPDSATLFPGKKGNSVDRLRLSILPTPQKCKPPNS